MTHINQTHGDHWSAIYGEQTDLLIQAVPDMVQKAGLIGEVQTHFTDEQTGDKRLARVFGLNYPLGDEMDCLFLVVTGDENHQIVSFYPHCKQGLTVNLTICQILAWDNGIEGYLIATDDDGKEYGFLDTLFFMNKDNYQIGGTYRFLLSALSAHTKTLQETAFELTGDKAKSFLAKIGKSSDDDGEPVRFDVSNMVALLQFDKECPDLAEFQSPIKGIKETLIANQLFYQINILISEELKERHTAMPLYVKKDTLDPFDSDKPICGLFWLLGHCVDN